MKHLRDMPVWAPSDDEMRAFERRVRAERAAAFRGAVSFVARKLGDTFTGDRAADKIDLKAAKSH